MTPLPDEQPLSRRQLREQQRTTEPSAPVETPSRRVSTSSATRGGDIPDVESAPPEPSLSTAEVAVLEEAEASGRPLTRRQVRDLERVRTASVSVVSSKTEKADAAATAEKDVTGRESQPLSDAHAGSSEVKTAPKATTKKNGKRDQSAGASKLPSFVPSSAKTQDAAEVVDAEIVVDDAAEESAEASRAAFELLTARHPESAFGPAASAKSSRSDDASSQLSRAFGKAVLDGTSPSESAATPGVEPFDQIIARGLEEAGSGVSTSSIILPVMPNAHPLTGPLSANGSVVVTGSIDLPSGMGSNGAHPDHFDKSDIDAMFDAEDEARPATAGTPVSASKAVSTHTATRDVITPPAPARSNRLLLILAITAGVLAVAVLAVIIVGIAAGAFQSR